MTEIDSFELEKALSPRRRRDGVSYPVCSKCGKDLSPNHNCGNWKCDECVKWFLAEEYGGPKVSKAFYQKHMQERHPGRLVISKKMIQGYRRCVNCGHEWHNGGGKDECPLCSKAL